MIDLHSHTDQSDGTFTPEELVAEAVRVGLKALAITDHDTFRGHDMAAPLAEKAGLELICGIELSTRFGGASVHLLSYFPSQPPTAEFRAWLDFLLASRRDRNRRLIERLQALGVDITLEEVEQKGRTLTARPHFARTLVEKGYAANIQDAFDKYLDESAKGYVQRQEVPIAEAIERVIAAGGVASMAHPVRVAKNNWDTLAEYAGSMSRMGMQAIEVFHSDHTPENVAYYQSLANRFGLGVTGGSDFHGGNKPLISLGTGLRGNLNVPDSVLDGLKSLV
ncbi:MAG: 3,5-nucleoside bisphosphate phosphatase [Bryobacterales bacterium]|nr:3,5-nucleoside bisphosphate phosphatase [Bryobacterales bacterium]